MFNLDQSSTAIATATTTTSATTTTTTTTTTSAATTTSAKTAPHPPSPNPSHRNHHHLLTNLTSSAPSASSSSASSVSSASSTCSALDPSSPSNHPHHYLLSSQPPSSDSLAKTIPIVSFDSPASSPSDTKNPLGLDHAEFGFDHFNQSHRYISQFRPTLNLIPSLHHHQRHPQPQPLLIINPSNPSDQVYHISPHDIQSEEPEEPGYWVYLSTYLSYLILILFGHLRDFFGKRFKSSDFLHLMPQNGYAALNSDFDSFYTRRLKARMDDCFARPVTGVAGRTINLIDRVTLDHCKSFLYTHQVKRALNISSYNYLGFAQSKGYVADHVEESLKELSLAVGGSRMDVGSLELHVRCEKLISRFLGVEDSMLISQGFATNSTTFPTIASKGTLIISDEFNHSSIRFGSRLSGAMIRQYKHNDMSDLAKLLRESISQGQPRTHRPWKKIIVVVEGIYSMEGTIVNLPALYALKAIYKFYLYVDEAHSIGALGPRGKGVCDYYGLDPGVIDIMMGTLTKSFGASGGYIAGKASIINQLRLKNHSSIYGESMSPPVIQQIISSLTLIAGSELGFESETTTEFNNNNRSSMTVMCHEEKSSTTNDHHHHHQSKELIPEDCLKVADSLNPPQPQDSPFPSVLLVSEGQERLRRLAFNARYLSSGLRKLGFIVYGDRDSPIIPLLIFHPGKMLQFSRMMLEEYSIVVVVVAYPATPLVSSRVRFCVSASHTKHDIDKILIATDRIGEILGLKMSKRNGFLTASTTNADNNNSNNQILNIDGHRRWSIHQVLNNSLELVEA